MCVIYFTKEIIGTVCALIKEFIIVIDLVRLYKRLLVVVGIIECYRLSKIGIRESLKKRN